MQLCASVSLWFIVLSNLEKTHFRGRSKFVVPSFLALFASLAGRMNQSPVHSPPVPRLLPLNPIISLYRVQPLCHLLSGIPFSRRMGLVFDSRMCVCHFGARGFISASRAPPSHVHAQPRTPANLG